MNVITSVSPAEWRREGHDLGHTTILKNNGIPFLSLHWVKLGNSVLVHKTPHQVVAKW